MMKRLALFLLIAIFVAVVGAQTVQEVSGSDTNYWRLTERGWQDSTQWIDSSQAQARPIEDLSPILFAANLLFASTFFLIWCSDEYQLSRLRKKRHDNDVCCTKMKGQREN